MSTGLQWPLQRGSNDFIWLESTEYVNNRIETLITIHSNPFDGTGELEWDQSSGTMTEFLRHRNVTRGRLELLTMHLIEQFRKWEPNLIFTKIGYYREPGSETVRVTANWRHKRLAATGTAEAEIQR